MDLQNNQTSLILVDAPTSAIEQDTIPTLDFLYVLYLFLCYVWPAIYVLLHGMIPWLLFHLTILADDIRFCFSEEDSEPEIRVRHAYQIPGATTSMAATTRMAFSHDQLELDNRQTRVSASLYYLLDARTGITAKLTPAQFVVLGSMVWTTVVCLTPVVFTDFCGGGETTASF